MFILDVKYFHTKSVFTSKMDIKWEASCETLRNANSARTLALRVSKTKLNLILNSNTDALVKSRRLWIDADRLLS